MNKVSKAVFGFLRTMVVIALLCVFIRSVFVFKQTAFGGWQVNLAWLLGAGVALLIPICVSRIKTGFKILLVLLVAFALRLVWVLCVPSVPVSDFLIIYNAAGDFLNGNVEQLRGFGHLARFPHLVPMMVYMMGMIKLFGTYHIFAMKCVSIILSVVTVYLIYVLSGYFVKKQSTRIIAMAIAAIYPPFISYSSTFCTETIGVPLFILSVILFFKAINSENKRLLRFLLCGCVLYCSNLFRGVAIVFLIAFAIYMLVFVSKNKFTGYISLLAGYFAVSIVVSSLLLATGVIEQPLWKSKEPSFATLTLKGSNFQHGGAWNADDESFVVENLGNENLSSLCFDKVRERLNEKSAFEIATFYGGKFIRQWSTGDCNGTYWATVETDIPDVYPVPKVFQLIYMVVIFMGLLAFFTDKKHSPLALIYLLLCGFGTVFVVLETQPRYSYIVSWVFILTAVYGIENLSRENKCFCKLLDLYAKYKMQANYLIFGVVTTMVNVVCYYLLYSKLDVANLTSTIIAWFLSVIVAYVTNKIWVFESKSAKPVVIFKELTSFFACRLLTGFFDLGIMWIGVDLLFLNATLIKFVSNVIVVILNYVVSKLFVFKNGVSEK